MTDNRRVVLASRPAGWVSEANFRLENAPMPKPAEGEVLVKNLYMSVDPAMRPRLTAGQELNEADEDHSHQRPLQGVTA